MEEKKKRDYQIGVSVLVLLALLTVGEYLLGAIVPVWWTPLLGIAALKAFFVVRDYMHISRLFAADEEIH